MQPKFAVFKLSDVECYAPNFGIEKLLYVAQSVEDDRRSDGKAPFNEYLVINRDEPYADEVIEIMKRHGHWEADQQ